MKSGHLTEIITLEHATESINDAGTPSEVWTAFATVRAEKVEQSTAEAIQGFGAGDTEVIVFRARFVDGLTNADRVTWRGEAYDIKQISPLGRRLGLELRCVRGKP